MVEISINSKYTLPELEQKLTELCKTILGEFGGKPSKASHSRVRKATTEFEKLGKEYRKVSIEADKKSVRKKA